MVGVVGASASSLSCCFNCGNIRSVTSRPFSPTGLAPISRSFCIAGFSATEFPASNALSSASVMVLRSALPYHTPFLPFQRNLFSFRTSRTCTGGLPSKVISKDPYCALSVMVKPCSLVVVSTAAGFASSTASVLSAVAVSVVVVSISETATSSVATVCWKFSTACTATLSNACTMLSKYFRVSPTCSFRAMAPRS